MGSYIQGMATSDVPSLTTANEVTESASKTDFTFLECNHTWTIKNFSKCWMKLGEELKSPTFFSKIDDNIKWCLSIYPGGNKEENKDYVSVYLTLVSSYNAEIRVKYKFFILNDKREKKCMWEKTEPTKFLQNSKSNLSSFGRHQFVLRSYLMDNAIELLPDDNLSIFCEVNASTIIPKTPTTNDNAVLAADHWGCTKINIAKVTYMWTIRNFRFCKQKTGVQMVSPIFPADADSKFKWKLHLYPNGQAEKVKEYLSIFVHPATSHENDVEATINLHIINSKRAKTNSKLIKSYKFVKGATNGRGFAEWIKRDFLLDKSNGLLTDDKLVIFCEIKYTADVINISGENKPIILKMPECRLTDDFEMLLENQVLTDVTLVGREGEFRAHKAILAARSSVFADMFGKKTDKKSPNRVEINDIYYLVLKEMLRFIYTGKVKSIEVTASALLTAADKYNLQKLKVMCEQELCAKIGIENAAEMLIIADKHSAEQLKAQTVDFINTHAKEVMDNQHFKLMFISHPELIAEVALEHLLALTKNDDSNELLLFDKEQKSST